MPLTALHAEVGVLDATTEHLGGLPWAAIYRARPRVPLACRECGHGLHAKVSRNGMRFFAHDPNAPECSLVGESVAHRLLKLLLASAIRSAGWFADLEVAGDSWRADVMATSPDGRWRMAWEAQLASIHLEDVRERTRRMAASGVRVCWVVDRERPWLGEMPAVQIAPPSEPGDAVPLVAGLGIFREHWCPRRRHCIERIEGPCDGHGDWRHPGGVTLEAFVAGVLQGTVRRHTTSKLSPTTWPKELWTTSSHVSAEQRFLASQPAEPSPSEHDRHLAALEALLERQDALVLPAVEHLWREARTYARTGDRSPDWAMGVPLFLEGKPAAVICPVVSRVKGTEKSRLAALIVFAASEQERRKLARVCSQAQRIVVLDPAR